jgi:hypothetical protein
MEGNRGKAQLTVYANNPRSVTTVRTAILCNCMHATVHVQVVIRSSGKLKCLDTCHLFPSLLHAYSLHMKNLRTPASRHILSNRALLSEYWHSHFKDHQPQYRGFVPSLRISRFCANMQVSPRLEQLVCQFTSLKVQVCEEPLWLSTISFT